MDLHLLLLLFKYGGRAQADPSAPGLLFPLWTLGSWALETMSVEIES